MSENDNEVILYLVKGNESDAEMIGHFEN